MRKFLSILLRLLLVGGCLTYVLWDIDFQMLGRILTRYNPWMLLAVLLYSFIEYFPVSFRLRYLTGSPALLDCLKATLFGLGMNNIFPAKLGEAAKAYYLSRKTGHRLGNMLGLVFWERFFDLNMVLLIGLCSVAFIDAKSALIPLVAGVLAMWGAIILLRLVPATADLLLKIVPTTRLKALASDIIGQVRGNVRPGFFLILGLYTVAVWVFYAGLFFLLIRPMAGLNLPFGAILIVFVVSALGMGLPSSPGGLGVFEAAVVLSLGWFGTPKEEALGVALVARFVQFIPTTLAALVIMSSMKISLKDLEKSQEEAGL